jgi:membrane glycosyltransferase
MHDRSTVMPLAGGEAGVPVVFRRALFFILVTLTSLSLLVLAGMVLWHDGFDAFDVLMLALFAATLPWQATGLWNSTFGFFVMRFARDPIAVLFPGARVREDEAVTTKTAILICIRNEMPERVIRNLATLAAGLSAAGVSKVFRVYVLSDTTDPAFAALEDQRFGELASKGADGVPVVYRRRATNAGFKAGNIRDFCERWGAEFDFALILDADSFMSADAVLRLVRIMERNPKLGILQSLVVGLPSTSAFARLFQFGMRLGMRSYTIGSAWWQADCGPYWGHNAIIRLAPFIAHCQLPDLSANGRQLQILSHDQIEAVLMRRAGYEVRVLPLEQPSWEENPATLIEFIRRDLRWCHGNMQYWRLLGLPGIKFTSRYQLAFAIMMFLGSPGWIGLLVVGTAFAAVSPSAADHFRTHAGAALLGLTFAMCHWPKLVTFAHIMSRAKERAPFGGALRFVASMMCETVFSTLLAPIVWFAHTMFLTRLPFGRSAQWGTQLRDDHRVPVSTALRLLWPQTTLGIGAVVVLACTHPAAIPYALPLAAGLGLSIPLSVISAMPKVGAALVRIGIGRLPEETVTPSSLQALALPALTTARSRSMRRVGRMFDALRTARGVARSLRIYYCDRRRREAMDRLYARFVAPGSLVFDVGAHVGDRVAAFRRLKARVVAFEPQPALARTLKVLFGGNDGVVIESVALGSFIGHIDFRLNLDNPTVSTASNDFVAAAKGARGWDKQAWTRSVQVPITTLDSMIARYGMPSFIKIDVEGFEADVLCGITQPVAALSFEFTTIQRNVGLAAIDRCIALGLQSFNAALGESQTFVFGDWQSVDTIRRWLIGLPDVANSGDIYAVRE